MLNTVSSFNPPFYLKGGFAQSILAQVIAKKTKLGDTLEHTIELSDGDKVILLENKSKNSTQKRPVLLVHGLGSSAHEPTISRLTKHLINSGRTVYRLNHRGVANGIGLANSVYHGARYSDIADTLKFINTNLTSKDLDLVFYSLSSNLLMGCLANEDKFGTSELNLNKILCISPIFDLGSSSKAISKVYFGTFNKSFMTAVKKYFSRQKSSNSSIPQPDLSAIKTLAEFDEQYIAKHFEFESASDYYKRSSTINELNKVTRPVTLLIANDDPIAPTEKITSYPNNFNVVKMRTGGHLGFLNSLDKKNFWLDNFTMSVLEEN